MTWRVHHKHLKSNVSSSGDENHEHILSSAHDNVGVGTNQNFSFPLFAPSLVILQALLAFLASNEVWIGCVPVSGMLIPMMSKIAVFIHSECAITRTLPARRYVRCRKMNHHRFVP